jgi:hypothetical protein
VVVGEGVCQGLVKGKKFTLIAKVHTDSLVQVLAGNPSAIDNDY